MAVPSAGPEMLLFTVTWMVSPQLASIKGLGLSHKLLSWLDRRITYPWVLAIDQKHVFLVSIWTYSPPSYCEIV